MDPFFTDLSGYVAGILTTLAFVPQVVLTFRTRSTGDVSLGMYLLLALGVGLWFVHGLGVDSLPVILANGLTLVLILSMVVMKCVFRGAERPGRKP